MRESELTDEIEMFIDRNQVPAVLEIIAGICREKAQHIEESYDDDVLAGSWSEVADEISETAESIGDGYPGI